MSKLQQDISGYSLACPAARFLQGALCCEELADGWVHPERFSKSQMRALGSCLAWHPGLYRQMARCTSGVLLSFTTDSQHIALELLVEKPPQGTQAVLRQVPPGIQDSLVVGVDKKQTVLVPISIDNEDETSRLSFGEPDVLRFSVESQEDTKGMLRLPGFGEVHQVRIWFPCLTGVLIRTLFGDGSFLSPVEAQKGLVVIGDSIAQGFVVGSPTQTWPTQLARKLKLNLCNQSIGGQIFQAEAIEKPNVAWDIELVIVALGSNYRFEKTNRGQVKQDIRRTLHEVAQEYKNSRIIAVTPFPHFETLYPTHPLSCFSDVEDFIFEAARSEHIEVIRGADLIDENPKLFVDDDHPNVHGATQIASRLADALKEVSKTFERF